MSDYESISKAATPRPWANDECLAGPNNQRLACYCVNHYDALKASHDELVADIEHIAEYWNGSYTDGAMSDALDHILEVCDAALARARALG